MNKKTGIKVLFIYPNPMMDNLIPIGISLLSACLKDAGHDTKLFDTTFYNTGKPTGDYYREKNLQIYKTNLKDVGIERKKDPEGMVEDFKKVVESYRPDLIALSVFEISYLQGLTLLRSVKDYPAPKIVGGVHATFSPEELIREDCVDMVCVGEGEDAIVELAERISQGRDYSDVKNLLVKKDADMIKNPLSPLKDINTLPFLDWDIYDKKRLYKPFFGKITATAAIETSRGCVGACTYCCNPAFQKMYENKGKFFRVKNNKNIFAEIKYLKNQYDIGFIYFIDADFLVKPKSQLEEFAEIYKKEVGLPFLVEARAEHVNAKNVELLEKMGCRGIAIGVESGNEQIRNEVLKKGISDEEILNAFAMLKRTKMVLCANNIIGIPDETRKDIFETIEINRMINLDNPIVNIFNPYRGTPLRDVCVERGYIEKNALAADYRKEAVFDMPGLSKKDIAGLQRTFPMYVKFSKSLYPIIKIAEKNDFVFSILSHIYKALYLKKKKK